MTPHPGVGIGQGKEYSICDVGHRIREAMHHTICTASTRAVGMRWEVADQRDLRGGAARYVASAELCGTVTLAA